MSSIKKKSLRWYFFRAPVYLYRWGLGGLLSRRVLLLKHTGRRSGRQRETVLEVVQYRKEIPEVFVVAGFGRDSDWLLNVQAQPRVEVTIGWRRFSACARFPDLLEAPEVIRDYEQRNRFIAPIIRYGFSRLLGWQYHNTDADRRRFVEQLPVVAFRGCS
jgi:deazaflavin-dependent oxidoreductase (nitroreductase family)